MGPEGGGRRGSVLSSVWEVLNIKDSCDLQMGNFGRQMVLRS